MTRYSRWVPVSGLVFLALCASGATLAGTAAKRSTTAAETFTINVDGVNPKANETFLAYFPRATTVHAGDTVIFHYVGVGEPHTVTLGSLADNAVSVFAHLTPAQQHANAPPSAARAADAALPQLFPQGPGDAIASAADKCFVQSGTPGTSLCPLSQHEQPDFNGTQSYYNSGWLDANQKFTVHFSSSTAPGTYRFMCLLHREFMSGKVTVAPVSKTIQSPATQFATGQKQQAGMEAQLAHADAALRQGKPPPPMLPCCPTPCSPGREGMFPPRSTSSGPSRSRSRSAGR